MAFTPVRSIGYIGTAVQTVQGTAVAPAYFHKYRKDAFIIKQKNNHWRDGNVRDLTYSLKNELSYAGSWEGPLFPAEGGQVCAVAMGLDSISGAGDPYTHTLTLTDNLPYCTVEKGMYVANAGGNPIILERTKDCKISKLEISGKAGGDIILTPSWIGCTSTIPSVATVTFTDPLAANGPATFSQSAFTIAGPTDAAVLAAQIQDFKLTLDQGLQELWGPNQLTPIGLVETARVVTVDFNVQFAGNTLYLLTYYGATGGTVPSATIGTGTFELLATVQAAPLHTLDFLVGAADFEMAQVGLDPNAKPGLYKVQMMGRRASSTYPLAITVKNFVAAAYF